jgi:hypothetical protein
LAGLGQARPRACRPTSRSNKSCRTSPLEQSEQPSRRHDRLRRQAVADDAGRRRRRQASPKGVTQSVPRPVTTHRRIGVGIVAGPIRERSARRLRGRDGARDIPIARSAAPATRRVRFFRESGLLAAVQRLTPAPRRAWRPSREQRANGKLLIPAASSLQARSHIAPAVELTHRRPAPQVMG